MSNLDEDNTGNVGTIVPGEAEPSQQQSQTDGADDGGEIEARARSQGWVPKEDFRGPEEKWKPADEFVRHGEETLPILRERNKDLSRKTQDLEARLQAMQAETTDKLSRIERMSAVALSKQREQLLGSFNAAKLDAVNSADTQRYQQLARDEQEAVRHFDAQAADVFQPVVQQAQPTKPQMPPAVAQWVEKNPWYVNDQEMQVVAQINSQERANKTPGITLEENLAATEKYMRQRYPDKFPASQQRSNAGGPAVEGGSRFAGGGTRSKGVAELPSDARSQGEKYVKQGLFKDINEYARDYWSQ